MRQMETGAEKCKNPPIPSGMSGFLHFLTYILWNCAPELVSIKEIIKRNSKTIAKELDGDNSWIMAVAINNVF